MKGAGAGLSAKAFFDTTLTQTHLTAQKLVVENDGSQGSLDASPGQIWNHTNHIPLLFIQGRGFRRGSL